MIADESTRAGSPNRRRAVVAAPHRFASSPPLDGARSDASSCDDRPPCGATDHAPRLRERSSIRSRWAARGVAAAIASASSIAAWGCAGGDSNQTLPPVVVGMTKDVAPYYSDGQITIYEVQAPVSLPVRKATDGERSALGKAEPYPRAPFVLASDLRIEIRFTLSNLDDHDQNVELLIDPWNEFVRYRPGVTVVSDEETIPNFSGFDKFFVLPAKSRIQGTITPDDTMELAVDLATAENLLAHPPDAPSVPLGEMVNHIFNLQNRSNQNDVLITPYIPKVIAGLTGFDVGIRSYAAGNVALEAVVDVTDLNGDRVLPSGSSDKPIGPPGTVLSPPTTAGMAP